ncbi:hypothetical protein DFH07DRAFT_767015 [Mycena maculata]|uniref:Uncharacterized protein n=1 Tax=Mycena maculata TaxID=230809 RepID=A0AAD7K4J5_9AGAR|nr:hypothetical protein DFH07DRAFT_767015 [Mycena maculata]
MASSSAPNTCLPMLPLATAPCRLPDLDLTQPASPLFGNTPLFKTTMSSGCLAVKEQQIRPRNILPLHRRRTAHLRACAIMWTHGPEAVYVLWTRIHAHVACAAVQWSAAQMQHRRERSKSGIAQDNVGVTLIPYNLYFIHGVPQESEVLAAMRNYRSLVTWNPGLRGWHRLVDLAMVGCGGSSVHPPSQMWCACNGGLRTTRSKCLLHAVRPAGFDRCTPAMG